MRSICDLCKTKYGKEEDSKSTATRNNAKSALQNFFKGVHKKDYNKKNVAKAIEQLEKGLPVYMSGKDKNEKKFHAWVVDGVKGNYFHINWGWNGASDGYFAKGNFDASSISSNYDDTIDGNTKDKDNGAFNYTVKLKFILYSSKK